MITTIDELHHALLKKLRYLITQTA